VVILAVSMALAISSAADAHSGDGNEADNSAVVLLVRDTGTPGTSQMSVGLTTTHITAGVSTPNVPSGRVIIDAGARCPPAAPSCRRAALRPHAGRPLSSSSMSPFSRRFDQQTADLRDTAWMVV
jgi:hypothetical protein